MNRDSPESQPRYILGIDLGTTNSAAAFVDTWIESPSLESLRIPQLVSPGVVESRETLPSFLYRPAEGEFSPEAVALPWKSPPPEDGFVGVLAREHGGLNPGRQIASAKSWLCHSGVDRTAELLPWHGAPDVPRCSPVQAEARYLDHIREAWDHAHPNDRLEDQEVIVTVPASFDEVARELTIKAARTAKLKRFRLIEEPLAAFYSWLHFHRRQQTQWLKPGNVILVCDIGGGTTDFTLIRVMQDASSPPRMQRIAVGRHLILGGDNLDLALAHHIESKHALSLDPAQWSVLVRQSCRAKESLLGENPPDHFTLIIPGRGTRLVGGTLQFELPREEVELLLVDGFLPEVEVTARPSRQASGFREFGLPYAADPAITRHLAEFLLKHQNPEEQTVDERPALRPDLVLFNGGFFYAEALKDRLIHVLTHWFRTPSHPDWSPHVLVNAQPDLAVALGAAGYGAVRRGQGTMVDAGLGRSYYLEISRSESTAPVALCLAPAELQEGKKVNIPDRVFDLLVDQPAEFPILVSSQRTRDRAGELVPFQAEEFTRLPPIRATLKTRRQEERTRIPVQLGVFLSELGALEIWCHAVAGPQRWRLQFDARTSVAPSPDPAANPASQAVLDEESLAHPIQLVHESFAGDQNRKEPAGLVRRLEKSLGQNRNEWPPALLRSLWKKLLDLEPGRALSVPHEARWLNLLGFSLRPGYGCPLDDWRVNLTWQLFHRGLVHPRNEACRAEWWILWRRIAAGLTTPQQRRLAAPLTSNLLALLEGRKSPLKNSPHELSEVWRVLGALERLDVPQKITLGNAAFQLVSQKGPEILHSAPLWALARIGSRVPTEGSLGHVVPPESVEPWLRGLMRLTPLHDALAFALMQLARRTGDRYREIPDPLRVEVLDWFATHHPQSPYRRLVEHEEFLAAKEQQTVFGESLPQGLSLATEG